MVGFRSSKSPGKGSAFDARFSLLAPHASYRPGGFYSWKRTLFGQRPILVGRVFVSLGCLLILASCALIRPTDPYVGMTEPLLNTNGTGGLDGRSAEAAKEDLEEAHTEHPLTLERAISLALSNNPEIAAASYALDAASATRDIIAAQRLPRIGLSSGYIRYLDAQRLVAPSFQGESSTFARDILSGDLIASMPLFAGGRVVNEVRAAELTTVAYQHRLARGRDELIYEVTRVFFDILAQRRVVESLEFSREALHEHLRRVEEMISVQKAAIVDRLRTEVRIADVEQRLATEQGALAIQKQALATFLGLSSERMGLSRIRGDLELGGTDSDLADEPIGVGEALELAYQNRQDYLAARALIEAKAKRVDAARGGHMPTIALQGSYGGRWAPDPIEAPEDREALVDVGRMGVVLDLPIFEGGRVRALVARERADLARAREELRALNLRVRLEVESAAVNIHSAQQRARATAKASEQAEESLRIERQRYELGRGSISDVLDAQAALLESQTSHLRALADYRTALAELVLAVGEEI